MRTGHAVTRMSSDRVAMRPIMNRMTDTHMWKQYLPWRSVIASHFIGDTPPIPPPHPRVWEIILDPQLVGVVGGRKMLPFSKQIERNI